jgi:hypothetical protein
MFNTIPFFIQGSISPGVAPLSIVFNTSFFYLATEEGNTPYSTEYFYNPNIQ